MPSSTPAGDLPENGDDTPLVCRVATDPENKNRPVTKVIGLFLFFLELSAGSVSEQIHDPAIETREHFGQEEDGHRDGQGCPERPEESA